MPDGTLTQPGVTILVKIRPEIEFSQVMASIMRDITLAKRQYLDSHPWITFQFDLRTLSSQDWMQLGEALSKCDHIAGVPLAPRVAAELHQIFLIKGVHATTQIEGNTLSEEEVGKRLKGDLPLPRSQEYLGIEVENVAKGCEVVVQELAGGAEIPLSPERIALFNKIVLDGLDLAEDVVPGAIRTRSVTVGNVYRGAPAADCDFLLKRLCSWLQDLCSVEERYRRPVKLLRAILAHLYLAWIHPFGDGNGRTARLIEFQLLVDAGLPTPACHLLSNYYNRTRQRYYQILAETSRPPYSVERFVSYAIAGFVEELREQLNIIRQQQFSVAWINYVHEVHHRSSSPTTARQRELVLSLPPGRYTATSAIRHLTPLLAELYAGKQQKTVTRDLNVLETAGLIEWTDVGVRPRVETMAAFLPLRQIDRPLL
ncbi:MAG TPA: Fic family protein [Micromonosporaceae bacterium]|nr:Fic family protein [Micromonosporaceae bacterium]